MKRNSQSKDVQNIFSAYDNGGTDRTSKVLRRLLKVCLYLILGYPVGLMLEGAFEDGIVGQAGTLLANAAAFAWFFSIVVACLMGAHWYGKNKD